MTDVRIDRYIVGTWPYEVSIRRWPDNEGNTAGWIVTTELGPKTEMDNLRMFVNGANPETAFELAQQLSRRLERIDVAKKSLEKLIRNTKDWMNEVDEGYVALSSR